jgi:hypothetical protein
MSPLTGFFKTIKFPGYKHFIPTWIFLVRLTSKKTPEVFNVYRETDSPRKLERQRCSTFFLTKLC